MVNDKISKPFKGIVLFPVHVRLNFTVEAYRYLIFRQAFCNTRRASMRMVYGVAAAFMVNTCTERYLHNINLLVLIISNFAHK